MLFGDTFWDNIYSFSIFVFLKYVMHIKLFFYSVTFKLYLKQMNNHIFPMDNYSTYRYYIYCVGILYLRIRIFTNNIFLKQSFFGAALHMHSFVKREFTFIFNILVLGLLISNTLKVAHLKYKFFFDKKVRISPLTIKISE